MEEDQPRGDPGYSDTRLARKPGRHPWRRPMYIPTVVMLIYSEAMAKAMGKWENHRKTRGKWRFTLW